MSETSPKDIRNRAIHAHRMAIEDIAECAHKLASLEAEERDLRKAAELKNSEVERAKLKLELAKRDAHEKEHAKWKILVEQDGPPK